MLSVNLTFCGLFFLVPGCFYLKSEIDGEANPAE